MRRVCFVVTLPRKSKCTPDLQVTGGAEFQCYLIAKQLASRGWEVAYITLEPITITEKSFRIYYLKGLGDGLLGRYSRAPSLLRFLEEINPDIVLTSFKGSLLGIIALYCFLRRRRFVFRAAHIFHGDLTFAESTGSKLGFIARRLHTFAVMRADAIVTNAQDVARVFERSRRTKSVLIIRNGLSIDSVRKGDRTIVLWLGRFEKQKDPDVFVRLARELPGIHFVMCGFGRLYEECAKRAYGVPNLQLTGMVNESAKRKWLGAAFAFVSTSSSEGFPNTLIEAGIYSVPYISFVDPDEVICQNKLGFHVNSFSELVEKTSLLANNSSLRKEMGVNIRHYVEREHRIENTVSNYERLLSLLLQNSRRSIGQES
jgi:glycosyltransferase involved in cell wall biosynthesis